VARAEQQSDGEGEDAQPEDGGPATGQVIGARSARSRPPAPR